MKRSPSLRYQRNMIIQGAVQETFGLKLGEKQGLQKDILVIEKSQVTIFMLLIQTPLSPSISGLFHSLLSLTHLLFHSFSYQAFTEYLLCVRLWGCSLVNWSCWKCWCVGFLGRGKQGWEGASPKSKFVRERIISDFWKWRDETPLKKKKKS